MHRKYEYLRWTVHHQHPAGVSACPCENSVTSPNWNLTNIVKTFSSKLGQHPLPGPLIHLCVVWKNKTSHHGIMTPLLLLESCPVLNRSDNRELYIHLDTMTPLRYRKISTISIKICIQGVPYYWAHFVFVIFSGSRAHTEELFIAIG